MKYAVLKCTNGNFAIDSEWDNLDSAKVSYHNLCSSLWNAGDVQTACVGIVDENLDFVPGYREFISHEQS